MLLKHKNLKIVTTFRVSFTIYFRATELIKNIILLKTVQDSLVKDLAMYVK